MAEAAPRYLLRSFADVFEKVPVDRIEACMREITALLVQAKRTEERFTWAYRAKAFEEGEPLEQLGRRGAALVFPEWVVWIDNGLGQVDLNLAGPGGCAPQYKVSTTVEEPTDGQ